DCSHERFGISWLLNDRAPRPFCLFLVPRVVWQVGQLDARIVATLEDRFAENVAAQPYRRVEPRERRCGLQSLKTTIAHNTANHSAILLLYERLIVLAIRPATSEYDTRCLTIVVHCLIHKHTVVVCIESEQIEWQKLS